MTERFVLKFGLGAAILSTLVFALCAMGLARTPWLALSAVVVIAFLVGRPTWFPAESPAGLIKWPVLFWLIALPFAVLCVVNAAAPEISPDGSYYHLGLVRGYFNHGGFYRITTNVFANFTQGCEMLFLAAYAVGQHSAAALVHCAFLLALPAALIAYGRRFGIQTAATIAALLVFVSPVAGIDGSSAYVDVALAFVGFACFYALGLSSDARMLLIAGLLAGFCFAIKYTGGVAILYALAFVLFRSRRVRPVIAVLLPAALIALPWLVKNWIIVDNPVSPFFNRLFPNSYVHISFEDDLNRAMRHFNGHSLGWKTPLELTVGGGVLQGTLGPAFLLAPVGLLAIRDPLGRRALGAAALFGLPWFSNLGTRFLIPALPFIALSMGITLARWPRLAMILVVLNAVACWPWVLSMYCAPYNWRITRFPIAAALRITPERQFLDTYAPEIRFARLLQDRVPEKGVVYTAQPVMTSYTDRTILLNYAGALNSRLEDALATAINPALQPSVRVSFGFVPREITRLRFVAIGETAMWTIHELELGTREDRADQRARPTYADPNRWDAELAGDGQLVTSWRSWQRVQPGRYLEAELKPTGPIGFVSFRTRPADKQPPMRLDAQLARGGWLTISSEPKLETGIAVPDLRGQAIAELRRCGVTHLLIHDQEPLGPDFRSHTPDWNVRFIGEAAPLRLYAILPAKSIDTPPEVRNNTR